MKNLKSTGLIFVFGILGIAKLALAQHLPEGSYHANRERSIDILHYQAELELDFARGTASGTATITLHPLTELSSFSLDAIGLNVTQVGLAQNSSASDLDFQLSGHDLVILLGQAYNAVDTLNLTVTYDCQPAAGMYFLQDGQRSGEFTVFTYGEGGLHANWLPIYNDVNDKFSTEMLITVPKDYSVVSNGTLLGVQDKGAKRQFHWRQELPHSNYLIAIYAAKFEKGELAPAFGTIPLAYWVPTGRLPEAEYTLRNTTAMVEFFSQKFDYRYPWDKYDQIILPGFGGSAMEHTGVTLLDEAVLRTPDAPLTFGPADFTLYHDFWTAEGTISHELAHHWFGDNLTCRNLSYLWLNESFASYLQMLWDEQNLGRETLLMDRQVALDSYLAYVANEHIIRPLEYHYFDKTEDIYNTEHTYYKGALVLNMLRSVLGDEAFFHAMSYYLKKHEFRNVDSHDFKIALEEATGKNLAWFFDDWIYGGGHPVLEVSYRYLPHKKAIDLNIKQVQAIVEGQGLFSLPVLVAITTGESTKQMTLWIEADEQEFLLRSDSEPLMVSVDPAGNLIADLRFEKDSDELAYQAEHDQLPGRIWALRQLASRFPGQRQTAAALGKILAENEFWGLQAEAAAQLEALPMPGAERLFEQALKKQDYRIRKAAVLSLAQAGTPWAAERLRSVIGTDAHGDVVATAIVALADCDPHVDYGFLRAQLGRPSWQNEIDLACLEAFGSIGDAAFVSDIKPYLDSRHDEAIRLAALTAWESCSPDDPALHSRLLDLAQQSTIDLQKKAIELLGKLKVESARPVLEKIVVQAVDANLEVLAKEALAQIERLHEMTGAE